jgi:hypothetical protein
VFIDFSSAAGHLPHVEFDSNMVRSHTAAQVHLSTGVASAQRRIVDAGKYSHFRRGSHATGRLDL